MVTCSGTDFPSIELRPELSHYLDDGTVVRGIFMAVGMVGQACLGAIASSETIWIGAIAAKWVRVTSRLNHWFIVYLFPVPVGRVSRMGRIPSASAYTTTSHCRRIHQRPWDRLC